MYKEKMYKFEEVLEQVEARIVPYDEMVPECDCEILLTNKFFAVLEDNYDGTYDEHYKIDVKKIKDIGYYKREGDVETLMGNSEMSSAASVGVFALFSILSPGSVVCGRRRKNVQKIKYLKLSYTSEQGKPEDLYFRNMKTSPANIIKMTKNVISTASYF